MSISMLKGYGSEDSSDSEAEPDGGERMDTEVASEPPKENGDTQGERNSEEEVEAAIEEPGDVSAHTETQEEQEETGEVIPPDETHVSTLDKTLGDEFVPSAHQQELIDRFLPPVPEEEAAPALQERIATFLSKPQDFNATLEQRKDFRNPEFVSQLTQAVEVDERASMLSWAPSAGRFGKSELYTSIHAKQKQRQQERANAQKGKPREFVASSSSSANR